MMRFVVHVEREREHSLATRRYYQLSTVLEYDTTYISQSEGCITRGAAEGDTAL